MTNLLQTCKQAAKAILLDSHQNYSKRVKGKCAECQQRTDILYSSQTISMRCPDCYVIAIDYRERMRAMGAGNLCIEQSMAAYGTIIYKTETVATISNTPSILKVDEL